MRKTRSGLCPSLGLTIHSRVGESYSLGPIRSLHSTSGTLLEQILRHRDTPSAFVTNGMSNTSCHLSLTPAASASELRSLRRSGLLQVAQSDAVTKMLMMATTTTIVVVVVMSGKNLCWSTNMRTYNQERHIHCAL
eukprot:Protomagalhaensia_sp_Gyna_25__5375@NODE_68_length_5665_cov_128_083185_g50_i0_p6_GENE_NODE_68_length_5665_cov_128_083185_g50_i0NODE_68_length_5665_cov_128_083185_g50_i0_p6_ORF_typecomplete_len136_score1_60PORR/PF11955_8/0_08_NODE_68_length_5665_cov_128_083185_g50_i010561463